MLTMVELARLTTVRLVYRKRQELDALIRPLVQRATMVAGNDPASAMVLAQGWCHERGDVMHAAAQVTAAEVLQALVVGRRLLSADATNPRQ
jgi:hypothetical protein